MPRTGGEITKKNILAAAEELFAQKGFHATSVNQITRAARVNKALVYYYFKDKNDIILSLFKEIIRELSDLDSASRDIKIFGKGGGTIREALKEEISYLEKKKKIISVMLMEALKSDEKDSSLFKCAEMVMSHEHGGQRIKGDVVFEFFTGFIPLITFVVLRDKFAEFFNCNSKILLDTFVEGFIASHIKIQKEKNK